MDSYTSFFRSLLAGDGDSTITPRDWQIELAENSVIANRLISIPTGFGKTLGVLGAWLYNRLRCRNEDSPRRYQWPHRLVWCLPMRTLVEQTVDVARSIVEPFGIKVHTLMGGAECEDWHLYPQEDAILVGTQDMLISRAINRGYGASPARWPMYFALLNNDCLWVLDEIQLMDVALITTAQMQYFRQEDRPKTWQPAYSWWMSATLQPEWLVSVDNQCFVSSMANEVLRLTENDCVSPLWSEVTKPISLVTAADAKAEAELIVDNYQQLPQGSRSVLAVLNTVDKAVEVYSRVRKAVAKDGVEVYLLHSRFRPSERAAWSQLLKGRGQSEQIIIATQVVEAGVDISASCLITELAPWASLVQRAGRAARYGGSAEILVVDVDTTKAKNAAPYDADELNVVREALVELSDFSPRTISAFEQQLSPERRRALYPYEPNDLLQRRELDELFDTTPDLTGSHLDVARFIRSGEERDCQVFWRDLQEDAPQAALQPYPQELCSVPYLKIRELIKGKSSSDEDGGAGTKVNRNALFVWDYLQGEWRRPRNEGEAVPGRVFLLDSKWGGYDTEIGYTGKPLVKNQQPVSVVGPEQTVSPDALADAMQNGEALSCRQTDDVYQTIAEHDQEVAQYLQKLSGELQLKDSLSRVLHMAAALHDLGKSHPLFQSRIVADDRPAAEDVAKAPQRAWRRSGNQQGAAVSQIRHELASVLVLFEALAANAPNHPALLGSLSELVELGVVKPVPSDTKPSKLGELLASLSKTEFNLLVYLIVAHHGKVRACLHCCPADQQGYRDGKMPIRGIYDGDSMPAVSLAQTGLGVESTVPCQVHLELANLGLSGRYGASWRERTLELQEHYGPFMLAWLETLLRVADIRVSRGDFANDNQLS